MSLLSMVRIAAVSAVVAFGVSVPPAAAQGFDTFVVVPDVPGGANFAGCYRGNPRLWDRYRLTFCLDRSATYWISGGGLSCNGRMTWRARGRDILISVQRTSCGNGVAWAAAEMTCQGGTLIGNIISSILAPSLRPVLQTLSCTYFPSVRGYSSQRFTARRTD